MESQSPQCATDRIRELQARLTEAEDTLRAIRAGEVDAVVVAGLDGEQVYTLRSAEQPYRTVVEQMQEGAAIVTAQGDVLYCNRRFAELVGRPAEEVVGGPVTRFIDVEDRPAFDTLMRVGHGTMQGRLAMFGDVPFDVYLSLTTTVVDQVQRRTLIVADLTELMEAQGSRERAERENRAKDEFVAMLAHELRNPLGAIAAAVQVMERVGTNEGPEARARDVIRRQVERLARLMGDLLDAASVNIGKISLERRPVDWADMVARHVASLRSEGVDRRFEVSTEPLWIDADPDRIEQVLANLLGNALKYTQAGATIRVRLAADGADGVLRVTDNGIGISEEAIARIFELFAQGEQPLDRRDGGLGIGLTVVRRLVHAHGGQVGASSDGPGRGSTFTVRLPRIAAPDGRPAVAAKPADVERRRILIVEDNHDAREMYRMALEFAGHQVFEAQDGAGGLDLLRNEPVDVALIDIGLPKMDGYEVARQFRAERGPGVLLVALTGYGAPEDRARSRLAGFDDHLIKPVTADALLSVLERSPRGFRSA